MLSAFTRCSAFFEGTIVVVLMGPEEVIIGDPEGDIVVGSFIVAITTSCGDDSPLASNPRSHQTRCI